MCAMTLERKAARPTCPHADAVAIGSEGHADLMRCRVCDQIFVRQASGTLAVRSMWTRVLVLSIR